MKCNMKLTRKQPILSSLAVGLLAMLLCLVLAGAQPAAADDTNPDFGPNVTIIDPSMSTADINALIAPVSGNQYRQIFFKPGTYGSAAGQEDPSTATDVINAILNPNTAIAGLGKLPKDTLINGALHVESTSPMMGALGTFARTLTNLSINPIQNGMPAHSMRWLTSQTCLWRRVHLNGDVDVAGWPDPNGTYAWGNMFANSWIEGTIHSGHARNTATSQGTKGNGMYYVRDSKIGGFDGESVIYLFSGVKGAPATDFDPGDKVNVARTPVTREAPFLYLDNGHYKVFVPNARINTSGVNWQISRWTGRSISLNDFYIAMPTDTAATLNDQLAQGKHLLLTPGLYNLDAPLQINRRNAVVMGLGFATLMPTAGNAAVIVGDVPGVILAAFSVNAGTVNSDVLVRIGTLKGAKKGNAANPTLLSDVHISVGNPGLATTSEVINQNHVLIDSAWIRRGGSGWTTSLADHGLVVNGDDVTVLGLWIEHYQKTQMLWNGNRGRVVFLEAEPPYDPPSQAGWMNGTKEGYPILKVADDVRSFKTIGFNACARFTGGGNNCEDCFLSSAIETPVSRNVKYEATIVGMIMFPARNSYGWASGGFRSIFNDYGPEVNADPYIGTSVYPNSDVSGLTVTSRIAYFPEPWQRRHE